MVQIKDIINGMVNKLGQFAKEVSRVSQEYVFPFPTFSFPRLPSLPPVLVSKPSPHSSLSLSISSLAL